LKKVIIIANTTWNIVNFRNGLVEAFLEQGFEVVVVTPSDGTVSQVSAMGCKYIPVQLSQSSKNPIKDLRLLIEYFRIFRTETPMAVLSFTIKPNIYGSIAARLCKVPIINNIAGLGHAFSSNNILNKLVVRLYRLALSYSEHVFFQNQDDFHQFTEQKIVGEEKCDVIPGSGVNLSKFSYAPVNRGSDDNIDDRDYTKFRFLMVARLLWDKGVLEFVGAARQIKNKYPDVIFTLAGFAEETNSRTVPEELISEWHNEGVINFVGRLEDVRPLLRESHCVVLPSYYREGIPRILIEAAATGRPVITTDSIGCRNAVIDGVTGILCAPRDEESLRQAMEITLSLSLGQLSIMGRNAREMVEQKFDEAIIVNMYQECLKKIQEK